METLTTISRLLSEKTIFVPSYQRAYSWDTAQGNNNAKQVDTFLADLEDYINSQSQSPYYLGHFLFEDKGQEGYAIIDGQQRLTTSLIFLSALYKRLKEIRGVDDIMGLGIDLFVEYCNTIKKEHHYRFSTVHYDNSLFRDYVIDQTIINPIGASTLSQKRIVEAFDYFKAQFATMSEERLLALHRALTEASCTTHLVKDEIEAVQMFIFQNNRGKKPSHLEVIKAQFMYHVHLHAQGDEKMALLSEITNRFEHIYRSISHIEAYLDEDNVLSYTIKVHRNTLDNINSERYISEQLIKQQNSLQFVKDFALLLENCFTHIVEFFRLEQSDMLYHSLFISAEDRGIMFPIMIKAMRNNMPSDKQRELAKALERIFWRHRIISTRAVLYQRLNDVYQQMTDNPKDFVGRINWICEQQSGWWSYWSNNELNRALNGWLNHHTAKLLLWKYENHLITEGKGGYQPMRYDQIVTPHLEHIAPQTENKQPDNGYPHYTDEFRAHGLEILGNYLLLSGTHNISLSNERFAKKRESYTHLLQQHEVRDMTEQDLLWDEAKIQSRHKKIVSVLKGML